MYYVLSSSAEDTVSFFAARRTHVGSARVFSLRANDALWGHPNDALITRAPPWAVCQHFTHIAYAIESYFVL